MTYPDTMPAKPGEPDTRELAALLHELGDLATGAKTAANVAPDHIARRARPFAVHAGRIVRDLEAALGAEVSA